MTRIPQRAFSGGILGPGMYARRDIQKWLTGLKDASNVILRAQGGAASRAGTMLVGGYDNSTIDGPQWLIPFEASQADTYMLEFGEQVMRVIKNGAYVLNSAVTAGSVVSVTAADPARLEMDSGATAATFTVGRLVYLLDPNGTSALHQAILEVTAISSEFITFKIVGGVTIDTTVGSWGTIGSGATLQEVYQVTSPYAIEDVPAIQTAQDVDTLFLAHIGYQPRQLVRAADDSWAFTSLTFQPSIGTVTGQSATNTVGSGSTTYNYKVAAVDNESGEIGLPSGVASCTNDLTTAGNYNTVSWSSVTGAGYYNVYKEFNGIYGFIGVTQATSFADENITADTSDNPQQARDPFSGANDKPSVVAFIEQRLTFAATTDNPQAVEMSSSPAPLNFNRALTPTPSDAISFRMRAQQLNRVAHIIEAEKPLILTAGGEWYVNTQDEAPMYTGNFSLRRKTARGSAAVPPPVLVGENVLHFTRDGNTLREFSLNLDRDTPSADLTILCRHLFEGKTVNSMAYAQSPDSVIWVTFTDGTCLSLTYLSEHEVWGWTRHEFAGTDVKVKQVAVVTEGAFDTPYFVIERTLFGQTVTLVERLDDRQFAAVEDCYFVDAGFHYSGASVTALRGFLHLRGEALSVLSDGNVLDGIVVTDEGEIVLPAAATKVSAGLGYEAYLVTLEADFGDQIQDLGASMGRFVSTSEVTVKVVDTRGIAVGLEGEFLNEVKEFTGAAPIPLQTATLNVEVEGDWLEDCAIEVRQVYPLPMTITAIAPTWTLGE